MSQTKLKTAILGLDKSAQELLEAAEATGLFGIVAAAGDDTEILEKIARTYQCKTFTDQRQLIIQTSADVLFAAAPIHLCDEHLRTAIKKKINILKLLPPGLNFDHTLELANLAKTEGVNFVIANPARFSPGFSALREHLESKEAENFHLITAVCNCPTRIDQPSRRWLTDPKLAGGGVLLHDCYEIIDQIVLAFGLPQQIYSLNTNRAPDKQQRLSLTEDTAVVVMKFSDTLMANLLANRTLAPPNQTLTLHTDEKYITARTDDFTIGDNLGNIISQAKFKTTKKESTTKMLTNFALNLLNPDSNKPLAKLEIDLNNMATIEAAYLSARTATPEEPEKIINR